MIIFFIVLSIYIIYLWYKAIKAIITGEGDGFMGDNP